MKVAKYIEQILQASPRSTPDKFTVDIPNENNRYDDLVDYNGRDIIIALPFKTTVYDILFFAIVDTINGKNWISWTKIKRNLQTV